MALSSNEVATGSLTNETQEYRLHVIDKKNGKKFLIDTGSTVSVMPQAFIKQKLTMKLPKLYAANSTVINTYGEKLLNIDLGFQREINWPFIVADVKVAIIGADLISHFGFLVDLKTKQLIDPINKKSTHGEIRQAECHGISTIDARTLTSQRYIKLLEKYADITKPAFHRRPLTETSIAHHIVTEGPPVAERPHKMQGEKLWQQKHSSTRYSNKVF